jgi:hypothetical protein
LLGAMGKDSGRLTLAQMKEYIELDSNFTDKTEDTLTTGDISYLCYLCLSLPPVVCRRAHVLFTLFMFVFTSSCL